ncbi:unnamed protein product [Prorocentrum cordatum]|uniref:S1 motif domain-containing protein n=1 Tax=Prorocentrum cordatum TaxID=2364126 RepID=A0ABN9QYV1_9DINO|nr:unnamed protein product [Polarella glacialis]
MNSDDEDRYAEPRRGRSPTPPERGRRGGGSRDRGGGRSRDRSRDRGGGRGGKDGGKGRGPRTTGREIPSLYSIHKGTIVSVQQYGAFCRLGDGSKFKDGLIHISRLSASGRVDSVEDVVSKDDAVWVKVVEIKEEDGKYSLDMRYVSQRDGEDKDPNNTQVELGKGGGKGKPDPIRIGAVQATTCSRCGARGHGARECFAASGKQYSLVEEAADPDPQPPEAPVAKGSLASEHDPKIVKAALEAYLKRKAAGAASSSSSSSSSSTGKKKKKKEKKKLKKMQKKEKKKEKKEKKKEKKEQKKADKAAKKDAKA